MSFRLLVLASLALTSASSASALTIGSNGIQVNVFSDAKCSKLEVRDCLPQNVCIGSYNEFEAGEWIFSTMTVDDKNQKVVTTYFEDSACTKPAATTSGDKSQKLEDYSACSPDSAETHTRGPNLLRVLIQISMSLAMDKLHPLVILVLKMWKRMQTQLVLAKSPKHGGRQRVYVVARYLLVMMVSLTRPETQWCELGTNNLNFVVIKMQPVPNLLVLIKLRLMNVMAMLVRW